MPPPSGSSHALAVLVSGHYDSVPTGSGVSDCGTCTGTTLEASRALRSVPQLEHDFIFLFTDGEELGVEGQ